MVEQLHVNTKHLNLKMIVAVEHDAHNNIEMTERRDRFSIGKLDEGKLQLTTYMGKKNLADPMTPFTVMAPTAA